MNSVLCCEYNDSMSSSEPASSAHDPFATTRWSLVVAARGTDEASTTALAELAQAYWYPIYAYVRRRTPDVHAAQDLTQSFFQRLLEKNTIAAADRERGRFRAFLLTACKRFLANEWEKAQAVKRGGGVPHFSLDFELGESKYGTQAVDTLTPDRLFEQQWAITLLARVLERLKQEMDARGKGDQFVHLKRLLAGAGRSESIATVASELGLSEGAVKVAAHRLRQRYRELLREEIAQTVADPGEVDDEIRSLFAVLGKQKD